MTAFLRRGLAVAAGIALQIFILGCTSSLATEVSTTAPTPEPYCRGPEQTYLTLPEWFLVHSPAEYAAFIKDRPPSDFPYFGHINQFWETYATAYDATKTDYPFNLGYHVMVTVIGTSTTVEYTLKSAYETFVGRLTEITRTHGLTAEDKYAANVAQQYVDFINVRPWYEFDFLGKIGDLWTQTPLLGDDFIRKAERKFALTSEYGIKAAYGWLIGFSTKAAYDEAKPETVIKVDHLPDDAATQFSDLKVLGKNPDGSVLVSVPRYAAFKDYTAKLARSHVKFIEIACNRSVILVSVLVPATLQPGTLPFKALLMQPILTQPSTKRIVLEVPIDRLADALNLLKPPSFQIEHVYDF